MQTHTTSVQMNVSETEKLLINILGKTKMEQNNEIKHIFHSKYTVNLNCFAQQRKQKVSWRTSAYHGKQERREMEVGALTAFTANAAVQVFCQWHIKPWLPTHSSAAVKLSNTLSLGFIHISICFRCSLRRWPGQNICVTTTEVWKWTPSSAAC